VPEPHISVQPDSTVVSKILPEGQFVSGVCCCSSFQLIIVINILLYGYWLRKGTLASGISC